jgi:periplasmic protein TonB
MLPSSSTMDLETWTVHRVDTLRLRRLFVGSIVGAVTVTASLAFVILSSKGAAASVEEDDGPIEVQLATHAEPEPPPPPPPPPAEKKVSAPRPRIASPLSIPDDKPEEKDPTPATTAPEVEEDEKEAAPAIATTVAPPPPPPPPKPKAVVRKPIRLTEDMPKPVQTVMKTPEYPSSAKLAGIEGVVIVKYVVGEDGSVRDAKVLKGPPELSEACLTAVRTWRFQPMVVDGAPISFVKIARFPFRIR